MRSAIDVFESNMQSVRDLHSLHKHFSELLPAMDLGELLRSEYVLVISAMDRYFHDIVREKLRRASAKDIAGLNIAAQKEFPVTLYTVKLLIEENDNAVKGQLLQADLRKSLEKYSFQSSKGVESALCMVGFKKVWTQIGHSMSMAPDALKKQLDLIIRRRNTIAHQADISDDISLEKNSIDRVMVENAIDFVTRFIHIIQSKLSVP